ncbi:MAG: class I SAM-dependent methyltransferase [Sphaerochaeta sp.]|jgi:SAM-dependent methyltransferase|nr:class I SAM-dependent methyltransferase [Sphaerochaeta sp.]
MSYYDEHADAYIQGTASVDMGGQYDLFLPHLKEGASILDAGCGSGRDSRIFLDRGYRVEAFDASSEMVRAASKLTGLQVRQLRFQEMEHHDQFDGIWASASLLHVPRSELNDVFIRLHRALKRAGILYASFKEREEDFKSSARTFTCFTENAFRIFIEELGLFTIMDLQHSRDLRPGREKERWLNVVLQRREPSSG